MALATIEEKQLTEFAEHVYETQKADFVNGLAHRIERSIDIGMAQCERGASMSLDESKRRIDKKHFKKFMNEKI